MLTPILHTQHLLIKNLQRSDADAMFAYRADPRVSRFQSWHPSTIHEVQQFVERYSLRDFAIPGTWFQLGIFLRASKALIGDIGIHFLEKPAHAVEIGFTVAPGHQRRGYAYEAVDRVIKFLSETLHVKRIFAVVMKDNHPSIALLSKLGALEVDLSQHQPIFPVQNDDRLFIISLQA